MANEAVKAARAPVARVVVVALLVAALLFFVVVWRANSATIKAR